MEGKNSTHVQAGSVPKGANFLLGGLAGMSAIVFVQPLDLVKNRMQLSGEGGAGREHKTSLHALVKITRNEGILGLYNGLSAGLFRQATYGTVRMGIYQSLYDHSTSEDGTHPSAAKKFLAGVFAGACGALVGTPAEVSLIRMTADGRLPPEKQRGYKNVFNALVRITGEEGVGALWRGCGPTVVRAMVVNGAELGTYSQAKQFLLETAYFQDNITCHFVASTLSGFVTAVVSMPADIAKTRVQNMRTINGVPEYSGAIDVLRTAIRKEGFFSLWKGFTPYLARIGPYTVLFFIFLEQYKILYYKNFCQ